MIETLAQIIAPAAGKEKSFVAGIVMFDDVVVETAPIVKYMKKWKRGRVREYCRERGWKVSVVHEMRRAGVAKG